MKLTVRGREEIVGERTLVMGILNATNDSFFDGGRYADRSRAVDQGLAMCEDGADIIDVGGESTRPGAEPVEAKDEIEKVVPIVSALAEKIDVPISVDTYKAEVAREAIQAGASIINDISAMRFDEGMAGVAAAAGVPVVIMHMKGTPRSMQDDPSYDDAVREIAAFLAERVRYAEEKGVSRECVIVDPGIGFGKTTEHNLQILRGIKSFRDTGCPVLVGPSRKSFIGNVLELPVAERLEGTAAAVAASVMNGADIVRVHDVKEMVRVVRLTDAIARG
ncbi:dihydropteroate synthase [Planctomycetota bacterium]